MGMTLQGKAKKIDMKKIILITLVFTEANIGLLHFSYKIF